MPFLGSKRRKTEADTQAAQTNAQDNISPKTLTVDTSKAANGPKSAPLRTKASSPNLTPQNSNGPSPRPGLNRNLSRSWYGSWNSKASAVAQVAKESISVAGGLTKESSSDSVQAQPGPPMSKSLRRGSKSTPQVGNAEKVNATRTGPGTTKKSDAEKTPSPNKVDSPTENKFSEETARSEAQGPNGLRNAESGEQQMKQVAGGQGWLGWWSRPDGYAASETKSLKEDETKPNPIDSRGQDASKTTENTESEAQKTVKPQASFMSERTEQPPEMQSRAWFGLWSASQNRADTQKPDEPDGNAARLPERPSSAPKEDTSQTLSKLPQIQTDVGDSRDRPGSDARPKSSGWAFWSKDSSQDLKGDGATQKHLGEIAVADTPSQSHPEAAQFNQGAEQKTKPKTDPRSAPGAIEKNAAKSANSEVKQSVKSPAEAKGNKQIKKTIQADNGFATSAKSASSTSLPLPEQPKSEASKKDESVLTPAAKALKAQQPRPNMIEPRFHTTFPKAYIPTYWETLGYYMGYPFGLGSPASSTPEHVSVSPVKPKIKNAIAIGVHGYFPAPLVQKIIGQPTGTSIKFATHAAAAIRSWTQANQPETSCEIEQVALEGEGFIADRVSTLWKLLLNWLSQLRNADFILVAAHSQGVPVAIMLVAKLIQLGCLNPQAKIGICAMAGVNLGPFADYKSRFFGGSAAELFEFSRSDSRVSREYASSVDIVLRHGVRITYVGSIDDQLVSLESSLFSNLTHPYVQRAVFVDGRLHAPDFITHLVAFALKLRNLGISDHGLIRELSFPLAGSIYGGEGHSRVYDDEAVYTLALDFALESTDMDPKTVLRTASGATAETLSHQERRRSSEHRRSQGGIPSTTLLANSIRRGSMSASVMPGIAPLIAPYEVPFAGVNANPYFLPWAMRGILEEPAVKKEMQEEVRELVRLFDEWKPASKALKDVKFRLEAVKSRL